MACLNKFYAIELLNFSFVVAISRPWAGPYQNKRELTKMLALNLCNILLSLNREQLSIGCAFRAQKANLGNHKKLLI